MKEARGKLLINDKEIPIVFNLNVMETIQEEYGTLDKWGSLTDGSTGEEPNAKACIFGFTQMINEGLEIEAEEKGVDFKPMTKKQVGRLITEYGLLKATQEMNKTVVESTQSDEKNA